MRKLIAVAASVVLCSACYLGPELDGVDAGPPPPPPPVNPAWSVGFSISDLTTNAEEMGGDRPLLSVGIAPLTHLDLGGPEHVTAIVDAIRLRTYPDLQNVPFEVFGCHLDELVPDGETLLPESQHCSRGRWSSIEVRPKATLSEGWYVLSLESLPGRMTFANSPSPSAVPLGVAYTRFRIGSAPIVSSISFCPGRYVPVVAHVGLSEGVAFAEEWERPAMTLTAPGGKSCTMSLETESMKAGVRRIGFHFYCDVADASGTWRFEAGEGFASAAGTPMQLAGGATPVEIEWESVQMRPASGECTQWQPEW